MVRTGQLREPAAAVLSAAGSYVDAVFSLNNRA
jgi:hypothetical protein